MLRNHLKIAFRNLLKQKTFTLINAFGLAIGVASCVLLGLYVNHELSYDKGFKDSDRIHRIVLERKYPDQTSIIAGVPHSLASVAVQDYPEIQRATTICGPFDDMMISYKSTNNADIKFLENDVYAADSNFFKIFSFNIIKGDRETMLLHPKSMILTESTAKRHFGDQDPFGKLITMSGNVFTVTGICEDPPANTHFKFGLIISINTIERFNLENFNKPDVYCYLKLNKEANPALLEAKLDVMVDKYAAADFEKVNKSSWSEYKKAGNGYHYFLCPLTDVYLYPENIGGMKPGGNIISIRIMIVIVVLILVVACINFINLATARSSERAMEVGVKKVLGSSRNQLVFQFLNESLLVSFLGVAIGAMLITLLLPHFSQFTDINLQIDFGIQEGIVLIIVATALGVLAGIYPSFVLSSFKPVTVLKGAFTSTSKGKWIRNGLVVFQFCISISLVICTVIMQQQMNFISQKDLGYDEENLVVIEGNFHMRPNFTSSLIKELKLMPQVVSAAGSLSMPTIAGIYPQQYRSEGSPEIKSIHTMYAGDEFAEVMDFKLMEGKLFSENTNDSLSIILNESAVKTLGLKNPIGEKINFIEQTYGTGNQTTFTIVGIIKDFHYETLHQEIKPLIIQSNEVIFNRMSFVVVRLRQGENTSAISEMENKWRALASDMPFQFRFLDNVLDAHYKKEKRMGEIFTLFSCLSIIVGCIGLFGLSAYTIGLRMKEIGIRKVFGASVTNIHVLLSMDFIKMILISFFIAVPVSIYVMDIWWLQEFPFRIEISPWTILVSGLVALVIAWITVGYQSFKASVQNPIKILRNE
ncbi:ABC transporter permease [Chryseotalea sanaruensis]|uniref:ABC transporter permease n=1 Tax=Chryseotalea sanaruensis TaxID=2482724 RepID=A0A401UEK9_9BACT|nr:ABC transporter permease [Chryseotalea sanaruensis]GCC53339.1 ABC transporter permease [Chryseotalea sanaruensis]